MKHIIAKQPTLIDDIKIIMIKLSFPVRRAQLRKLTDMAPVKCKKTCWSFVKAMIKRYAETWEYLPSLKISEVGDLLPLLRQDQHVHTLMKKMKALDTINMALQKRMLQL